MIGQIVLRAMSRPIGADDYTKKHDQANLEGALTILKGEFPDLRALVEGRKVLDFGCGAGAQSVALATKMNAIVTGIDINRGALKKAEKTALKHGLSPSQCRFVCEPTTEKYDVIISQNAMEHFDDPASVLSLIHGNLMAGGKVLMTFSPPWLAPYGHHMNFFCKLPWLHLLFSEKTVMAVRSRYRNDGAKKYTEVTSGLNKMTLAKFEKLIKESGFIIKQKRYRGVKGVAIFTRIPLLRELLTDRVTCVLETSQ